ncbi:MAG: hypothetical protein AAFO57_00530 [Pseudomonadota bacterium]
MDISTIRRMNVRILEREAGSLAKLAEMAGTKENYLSQCTSKLPARNIGNDVARRLESGMGKPYGWMDESHVTQQHLMVARFLYDKMIEMTTSRLHSLVEVLDLVDSAEREGSLGHIDLADQSDSTDKEGVVTLKDNAATSKSQSVSPLPRRRK